MHIRDHLSFGIISGPIWGSFPVLGSFARCTGLLQVFDYTVREVPVWPKVLYGRLYSRLQKEETTRFLKNLNHFYRQWLQNRESWNYYTRNGLQATFITSSINWIQEFGIKTVISRKFLIYALNMGTKDIYERLEDNGVLVNGTCISRNRLILYFSIWLTLPNVAFRFGVLTLTALKNNCTE